MNEDYDRQEAAAALFTPLDNTLAAGLTVAANKLDRPTQRTVVFGSGHLFSGKTLTPAQDKLLVHTANWLTKARGPLAEGERGAVALSAGRDVRPRPHALAIRHRRRPAAARRVCRLARHDDPPHAVTGFLAPDGCAM